MNWSYGVTTVPQRISTLLPRTLDSLAAAGFNAPRMFIDGLQFPMSFDNRWGCEFTCRQPSIGAFGNWLLAAWELYIRQPQAQMYAIFQDDIVMCRGVRQYLEECERPSRSYLNLFTFMDNERMIKDKPQGWHRSNQLGKGAVALAFDHEAMTTLLQQPHMVHKPQLPNGNQSIDGAAQHAMVMEAKFVEHVHGPSLVQHVGHATTIGEDSLGRKHPVGFPDALTFPGESFDAMSLLNR